MSGLDASVVMPVHNGAATIGAQLEALAAQRFDGSWEILVVDNGSTDETRQTVARWQESLPHLRLVDAADTPGAAHARNRGAAEARGDVLAFCDADDVVGTQWLAALVAAADTADIVGGRIDSEKLNDPLARRWRPPFPDDSAPISHGFLPYALGANVAFRAAAFEKLGGFREDYPAGEDVEIVWRGLLGDLRFVFAADAVVHYRYRPGLRSLLRQYVVYGGIGPRLYRDFGSAGMPPSTLRDAVGPWVRLLGRLLVTVWSREARGDVLRRLAFRAGRIRGSLAARVVYL